MPTTQPGTLSPTAGTAWGVLLVFILGLAALFILVITGKHRSMLVAQDGLKEVNWVAEDWVAPQIVLSGHGKEG